MKLIIVLITVICFSLSASYVSAAYFVDIEEIIAGNSAGFGARQMAMGGAGIMSMDGTSLFYNPANLARVPRIEFNLGLSYQRFQDESTSRPIDLTQEYTAKDHKTDNRLNSVILSIPYPTYRGSLVFGVGMVRASDFDRVSLLNYQEGEGGNAAVNSEEIFESGGLNQWGFGMGMDLSPRISFGGAVLVYTGKHQLKLESDIYMSGALYSSLQQLLDYKYLGIGAKLGLAMQLSRHIGLGLTAELPVSFDVEQDATLIEDGEESFGYAEYELKKPFVFSAGLISRFNYATLMLDCDYTDWTQFAYGDNYEMELLYNSKFRGYYRDVFRFRVGSEYVFPAMGLSLRAGYFYDPLPYNSDYFDKDRQGFSFGFGLLVDEVMTLDFAFVRGTYANYNFLKASEGSSIFTGSFELIDDIKYNRVYMTGAYRF